MSRLLSLLFLASVALIVGSGPASGPSTVPTRGLRVMSYNIHHGRGTDGVIDLQRVADVINAARPDLVAVQEVDVRTRRSGGVDQATELARLTGLHVRFGKGRDFEGGDYGQAILSRWPAESFEVHELPGDPDARADPEQERRVALVATFPPGDGLPALRFVATHLHHQGERHRLAQARRLLEILDARAQPTPTILTGDLNAVPGSRTIDAIRETFRDAGDEPTPTFPATRPDRKLDWIFLSKRPTIWEVVESRVIEEPVASDHRPIVAELRVAQ